MEWLEKIFQKITQIIFWQNLINQIHWVDITTLVFLILGIIYGVRKGFLRELAEILEFMVIICVTFFSLPMVSSFLAAYLPRFSQRSAAPAAFIVTALAAWFVMAVLDKQLRQWFHSKLAGGIKTLGGALAGAFHFILIWSFISQVVFLLPVKTFQKVYEPGNSLVGVHIKTLAPNIYKGLTGFGK